MGMGTGYGAYNDPYAMTMGVPEPYGVYGHSWLYRARPNFYNQRMQQPPAQVSPLNDLLAKAAAAKANAPSLASLFPSMGQGMLNAPVNYSGQFGAGRFLAPNASQFGNPSQPMGGFAPNVTNT